MFCVRIYCGFIRPFVCTNLLGAVAVFERERGRLFFIVGRLECFGALRHQSELHSIFVLQLGVWD